MRVLQKIRQWKAHQEWRDTGVWILDLEISKRKMRLEPKRNGDTGSFYIGTTGAECKLGGYPSLALHQGLKDEYLYEALEHEIIHHLLYKQWDWKTTRQLDNIAGDVQAQRELFGIRE